MKIQLSAKALLSMGLALRDIRGLELVECTLLEENGSPCRLCASGRFIYAEKNGQGRHIAKAALRGISAQDDDMVPVNLTQKPIKIKGHGLSPVQVDRLREEARKGGLVKSVEHIYPDTAEYECGNEHWIGKTKL